MVTGGVFNDKREGGSAAPESNCTFLYPLGWVVNMGRVDGCRRAPCHVLN